MIKIPSFLTKLSKEEKAENMELYKGWVGHPLTEKLAEHLEAHYTKLLEEEEKSTFLTLFQSKWERAKLLAKRELLRSILKDLSIKRS